MSYALLVKLEKGISFICLTHVDGKSRKRKSRKGTLRRWEEQQPTTFDQQAFMEAIGAATTTITQASAMVD